MGARQLRRAEEDASSPSPSCRRAVVDKQLKERTELTHSRIGATQRDSILAAGLALQQAGVIDAKVDVEATVDALIDDLIDERFNATLSNWRPPIAIAAMSAMDAVQRDTSRRSSPRAIPSAPAAPRALRRPGAACRPALGLLLPVALALGWEIAVAVRLVAQRPAGAAAEPHLRDAGHGTGADRRTLAPHRRDAGARRCAGFGARRRAGTLLGASRGYSGWRGRLLDPTLQALRAIPSIAWVPLFILWLGIFETRRSR